MTQSALNLLSDLIAIPSPSRSESGTADCLQAWLAGKGIDARRHLNNVWAVAPGYNPARKTLLLNSHHDTVKPAAGYTRDPFTPTVENGRLYGLGSNDAGASAVSLAHVFCHFCSTPLPFNLILALTAEEEVTGENGMRAMLPHLESQGFKPTMAIVGEPTSMQPAVGERGLVVLDCIARGVSGHAARGEGVNALYAAIDDINTLRALNFDRCSQLLGPISVTTTVISAGSQHNVVPDECRFTVDVRTTDAYTNEQTVDIIRNAISSEATPRSTRLRASAIAADHELVTACTALGLKPFVSPTMSDMAVMNSFPTLKIGPGESSRSHSADEYIEIDEIHRGINTYIDIINNLK
ncbi:MAG: M20 family metallo-hydrolase [Muribaculaceae bacterium]|nr:M20 family metallo-hydrolase [Muribaculaceae bacterium]